MGVCEYICTYLYACECIYASYMSVCVCVCVGLALNDSLRRKCVTLEQILLHVEVCVCTCVQYLFYLG